MRLLNKVATMSKRISSLAFTLMAAALWTSTAHADQSNSPFKISGFLSIVGGKVIQGDLNADYAGPSSLDGERCPCYIADWSNAGVYNNRASLKPESRVGVQATYAVNKDLSIVGQVVSRGTEATPNVQWAYGSYKWDKNWEVQVGRKRIPLYFYSDFQDVGSSYPWVSPPPELYGWEATNYNGASLRYSDNIGASNLTASAFVGGEKVKDSGYQSLYYSGKTTVKWSNLAGADLELRHGMFTTRAIAMQVKVNTSNTSIGLDDNADLKAYGIAFNVDGDNWFLLSELTQLSRQFTNLDYKVTAPAFTVGVGLNMGKWTPFINYAQYKESSSDHGKYMPQAFKRPSITVRYDVDDNSSIKVQLDKNRDTTNNFGGNSTVLRLSYDRLF
jgi:hypothetical protein